jgi:hypothetical protein
MTAERRRAAGHDRADAVPQHVDAHPLVDAGRSARRTDAPLDPS